jgi:hypothetical protein
LELQKQQEEEEEALNLNTVFILFTKKFAFLVRLLLLLPKFQNPNKKPRRSSKSVHVYPIWVEEEEPKRRLLGLGLEEHMMMMRRRRQKPIRRFLGLGLEDHMMMMMSGDLEKEIQSSGPLGEKLKESEG